MPWSNQVDQSGTWNDLRATVGGNAALSTTVSSGWIGNTNIIFACVISTGTVTGVAAPSPYGSFTSIGSTSTGGGSATMSLWKLGPYPTRYNSGFYTVTATTSASANSVVLVQPYCMGPGDVTTTGGTITSTVTTAGPVLSGGFGDLTLNPTIAHSDDRMCYFFSAWSGGTHPLTAPYPPPTNASVITEYSHQASASSATSLTDYANVWTVNRWTDEIVKVSNYPAAPSFGNITSNTSNTLTIDGWTPAPPPLVGPLNFYILPRVTGDLKITSGVQRDDSLDSLGVEAIGAGGSSSYAGPGHVEICNYDPDTYFATYLSRPIGVRSGGRRITNDSAVGFTPSQFAGIAISFTQPVGPVRTNFNLSSTMNAVSFAGRLDPVFTPAHPKSAIIVQRRSSS